MRKFATILGLVLGLFAGVLALAQPVYNWTGTETLKATTNFGTIADISLNQVRNTHGYSTVATGTTVTSTPTSAVSYLVAIGAITTWNITLPNPAQDGFLFNACNGTGSNFTSNVTVTANASGTQNQTLAQSFSSQSINAGVCAAWLYTSSVATAGTWYRMR